MYCCPNTGKNLKDNGNNLSTEDSLVVYPIVENIPVLILNYKEHMKKIEDFQHSKKSGWYKDDQVKYHQEGPYKFHIARRKKYVQNEIKRYLEQKELSSNLSFLDLGCGDGYSSKWVMDVLPKDTKFFLTDYNFDRIYRAKEYLKNFKNIHLFLSDVTKLPMLDNQFDIVFSTHVIEHLGDDTALFKTAFRVLKPGGILLLGCPNEGVLWWMLAYALSPASIRSTDHKHFYNTETIKEMGRQQGFKAISTKIIGYGFPHWTIDALLRKYRILESISENIGKVLIPKMGSSMYITFLKE